MLYEVITRELKLRALVGVTVIGAWEQGRFATVTPDTLVGKQLIREAVVPSWLAGADVVELGLIV